MGANCTACAISSRAPYHDSGQRRCPRLVDGQDEYASPIDLYLTRFSRRPASQATANSTLQAPLFAGPDRRGTTRDGPAIGGSKIGRAGNRFDGRTCPRKAVRGLFLIPTRQKACRPTRSRSPRQRPLRAVLVEGGPSRGQRFSPPESPGEKRCGAGIAGDVCSVWNWPQPCSRKGGSSRTWKSVSLPPIDTGARTTEQPSLSKPGTIVGCGRSKDRLARLTGQLPPPTSGRPAVSDMPPTNRLARHSAAVGSSPRNFCCNWMT